jgi:hypothetical protein
MPELIRQALTPKPFNTKELSSDHWRIINAQLSNEITVVRYLTSKIVYTEEFITLEEISVLFIAFEEIVKKSARDKLYRGKYMPEIFMFRAVFQSLDTLLKMDPHYRQKLMKENYSFYGGKLFSRRYFFAVKGQIQRLFEIRLKGSRQLGRSAFYITRFHSSRLQGDL